MGFLTCENPPLRIQTNEQTQEEVNRFTKDPRGDIWLQEETEIVKEWSGSSLIFNQSEAEH